MSKAKFYTCDDNYIDSNGEVREIAVTITLNEYRGLVRDAALAEAKIERLEAEIDELRKEKKILSDALAVCKLPPVIEKIRDALAAVFAEDDEESDEDDEIIAGGTDEEE